MGCTSLMSKRSIDIHNLSKIEVPLGYNNLLNIDFFPDKWETKAFISLNAKDIATNPLDSIMYENSAFLSNFYSKLHAMLEVPGKKG